MTALWTNDDEASALADGWSIFDNSDHGLRIERYGERFDCDVAAVAYVGMRASLGHTLARRAFEFLAWSHAVEDAARQEDLSDDQ